MLFKNVKVFSLDATNTLLRLRRSPAETYTNIAKEFGFNDVDPTIVGQRFSKVFKTLEAKQPCYGFYGAGDKSWWIDLMRECYGNKIAKSSAFDALADRVFEFYRRREAWCLTDAKNLDLLRSCSARGIKLAIVSNFDQRLLELLEAFGISSLVDKIVLSGQVGFQKPEPEIFQLLFEHFKIDDPKCYLHVGDSYEKDYVPATQLGMHALILADSHPRVPPSHCIRRVCDLEL